ncbi:MAG: DUF5615 family PIN-like protein [Chloroflexi bacterium]|nr:DUF5615 family PIN-like protein [Chloroflexota bacterium]
MPVRAVHLDECADAHLVPFLRSRGYRVTTAQEAGLVGSNDEAQLEFATRNDAILLSYDQRHFRAIHRAYVQQQKAHGGILLLPPGPLRRLQTRAAMMLDWIATIPDHRSQLFRWTSLQSHLTRGFRLPGYSDRELATALGQEPEQTEAPS